MVAAKAIMSLGETEAVKIEASASAAYIEIGEYMMVTRLIADSFMDYKRAFLSQPPMCARLPKKETMDALRRALLATNQDKCIIMLNFDTDKCTISAKSATGNYAEDIAGNFEKLNGFDIAFNSLYLIDAIKHFDSDDLTIYFAGRLRPAQMEKDGYRALVLPVKTKEGI